MLRLGVASWLESLAHCCCSIVLCVCRALGGLAGSEHTGKYNQLMRVEEQERARKRQQQQQQQQRKGGVRLALIVCVCVPLCLGSSHASFVLCR